MTGWGDFFHTRSIDYVPTNNGNCSGGEATFMRVINDQAEAVDDATAGMIIVILLFVLPSTLSFWPFVDGT